MSGADQAGAIELAIAQGSAIVRAHVFDAVDLPIDFHQNHEAVIDLECLGLIGLNLLPRANVMECRH